MKKQHSIVLIIVILIFPFLTLQKAFADVCVPLPQTPSIYQINRTETQATLFINPVSSQVTGYTVIYGFGVGDERYSSTFSYGNSSGAITNTINSLDSQKQYFFKIRANNICSTGPWSTWTADKYSIPKKSAPAMALNKIPVTGFENLWSVIFTFVLITGVGFSLFKLAR